MEEIQAVDAHRLRAAEGWLILGLPREAQAELSQLSALAALSSTALDLFWRSHADLSEWDAAFEVASRHVACAANRVTGWIQRSYAARRKSDGSLQVAYDLLCPGLEQFPEESIIPFNLACYAAQMQQLDEAWSWFERACKLGNTSQLSKMGLADPDLEPIWPRIKAGKELPSKES